MSVTNGTSDVMTVKELCAYLKLHQSSIYRMLDRGELPSFRVGSDHRFLKSSIDKWIAQREAEAAAKVKE